MNDPLHTVETFRDVRIPMRDGTRLAANITRPVANGVYPAVIEFTPYRKSRQPPYRFRYLAERGYVLLQVDVRGTGNSEGFTAEMYQPAEQRDEYDVIEWAAAQPWCNGKVGAWGISYCGVACWHAAMQAPPHLKAIVVRSGTDDVYTEWTNPGGAPRPYIYECYTPLMAAYNLAPPDKEVCGARWAEMWRERLERNAPWGLGYIEHLLDGPYWRERSLRPDYDRIRCAVFVIDGWADWYCTPLLRAFASLKVPKRALIGPWSHMWPEEALPGPRIDGAHECLRWFDHWLKGLDNGIMNEPPVTLFIRDYSPPTPLLLHDAGVFRAENEWPPVRRCDTPFYFREDGLLNEVPPAQPGGSDRFVYPPLTGFTTGKHGGGPCPPWFMPGDQRADDALALTYTTTPLSAEVEVTGQPRAVVFLVATAPATSLVVRLCDVAPDGTSVLVTKGYLDATHRNGHTESELLIPGRTYALTVELLACAYRFAAGHRLSVSLSASDVQNVWPPPFPCAHTIARDPERPSHIVLPLVPPQEPALAAPVFQPSPLPMPEASSLEPPRYAVKKDLAQQTMTVEYEAPCGAGINTAAFTVSEKEPARAVVKAAYRMVIRQPEELVEVTTQAVTTSDANAFHLTVEAEIAINGRRHFHKSWERSVPRLGR
jgi:putative CocE/NonD family hydrolase